MAASSHDDQELYGSPSSKALADDYSDPREIVQQRQRQASMTSMSSISPVNRERLSFTRTSGAEASTASIGRKPSATNISPFKSPSLSSSPIQQSGSEYGISQSKYYSSPTGNPSGSSRPYSYQSTAGEDGISSSARKVEFSSSFDRYKGSPSRGDIGTGMSRRLSRNSDHSLVDFVSAYWQQSNSLMLHFFGGHDGLIFLCFHIVLVWSRFRFCSGRIHAVRSIQAGAEDVFQQR